MYQQTVKQVESIKPFYTEQSARESVEKVKKPAFLHKRMQWMSSIPLYIPFWFVDVEMDLRDPKQKDLVQKSYTIMVNAITNRGLLLKGNLRTEEIQTKAIFLEQEISAETARETARVEALVSTKRMMRPPPHRVLPGERLVWYPLALVELLVNDQPEIQLFDYYRGGLDKMTMRFLRMKEKLSEKEKTKAG